MLEAIADGVKNGYLFIENGVVKGFTAVNDTITLGQTKARLEKNAERR